MKCICSAKILLPILVIVLAACAPTSSPTNPALPSPTHSASPTSLAVATVQPKPTQAPRSFAATTYKDETSGFKVDYPLGWTLAPKTRLGSRGEAAQLFSPGTTAEKLLPGGTRLGITMYQWDPKGDLAAYATHRKTAWESGGSSIVSTTSGDLVDGRKQMSFTIQGPDKMKAFFLLTTVGEQYLEIAGDGNLALIEEIAQTMRPLNAQP